MIHGAQLLDAIIERGDTYGDLVNATGDELRDALHVAADRLRICQGKRPRETIYRGARRLVAEVWLLVKMGELNARSLAADAALDLRDTIDTRWEPNATEEREGLIL